MARLPARVDWITHERTKVALRLNKSTMVFQAEWAGRTHKNKDGGVLREQILELIATSEHLVFDPIIEVKTSRPDENRPHKVDISLRVNRFLYTRSDHGLLSLTWEYKDHVRKARRWNPRAGFTDPPCHLPCPNLYGLDCHYLVYSDDMWAGLNALLDTIEQAKNKINEMLNTDTSLARIEMIGAMLVKMLPEGGSV